MRSGKGKESRFLQLLVAPLVTKAIMEKDIIKWING